MPSEPMLTRMSKGQFRRSAAKAAKHADGGRIRSLKGRVTELEREQAVFGEAAAKADWAETGKSEYIVIRAGSNDLCVPIFFKHMQMLSLQITFLQ